MQVLPNPSIDGGGFVRTVVAKTFDKILSTHMKRLVFISSLVGLVYQAKDPDLLTITKLNQVFDLANYPEAMQFPARVKSVIWRDKDLNILGHDGKTLHIFDVDQVQMNKEDVEKLSTQVTSQAPWWLKYGDFEAMKADVAQLFTQIQNTPSMRAA